MTSPMHHFRPAPLTLAADEAHRRLTSTAEELTVSATADALTHCAPLLRRWGVTARELPTVLAEPAPAGEPGSIAIRWRGAEDLTGWPAMSARLIVTPVSASESRLTLSTTRAPSTGLHVPHLSKLHGLRAVDVVVASFLQALARAVADLPVRTPQPMGASR